MVSNIFYVHLYLGKVSILTNIFQWVKPPTSYAYIHSYHVFYLYVKLQQLAQATKPEVEEKKIEIAPKAAALEVEVKEKTKASLWGKIWSGSLQIQEVYMETSIFGVTWSEWSQVFLFCWLVCVLRCVFWRDSSVSFGECWNCPWWGCWSTPSSLTFCVEKKKRGLGHHRCRVTTITWGSPVELGDAK